MKINIKSKEGKRVRYYFFYYVIALAIVFDLLMCCFVFEFDTEKIAIKDFVKSIVIIDFDLIIVVSFIIFLLWTSMCLFNGMLLYNDENEIYNLIKNYSPFDLNESIEKSKYITPSTLFTMFTFSFGIIFSLIKIDNNLLPLYEQNFYFQFFITFSVCSSLLFVYFMHNSRMKIIRRALYRKTHIDH